MFLQGNLKNMFEALYKLGIIDPVLSLDWKKYIKELPSHYKEVENIISIANTYHNDVDKLTIQLQKFDQKSLIYFTMEVAREYAFFYQENQIQ